MRFVGSVVAAWLLAAGILCGADCAVAADVTTGDQHVDRYLLFSGFDLWRDGGSAHGGLLWSPDGLAREGFTLKLLVAGGQYRYDSGETPTTGRYGLTSAMAGWRFRRDRLEVSLFVGPDFQWHQLAPDDPSNRLRGSNAGVRFGGDLWYQPTDTFMATGSLSVSSIGPNYWSRAAIGWYLFERAWIGPEVMALGGDKYRQFRAGVHATALRTGAIEWSTGFGYARDSEDHNGVYARFGVITRR